MSYATPEGWEGRGEVRPLSIAPMMDWTDRHYRYFMRQLTRSTLLYTEMITAPAILWGQRERYLRFDEQEHPVVIQLGGSDPEQLKEAAMIAEDWGYDEINLNVGCPSSRVQEGTFGACLMAEPERVAELVVAMREAVKVPVTVKHRIGIDELDRYEDMARFVEIVRGSGCDRFIVHARIAILGGLSPKENRTIPPLRFEDVYRLKDDFPSLLIEGNGQIKSVEEIKQKLERLDGAMLGRAAYEDPYLFASVDREIFGLPMTAPSRAEAVEAMIEYAERECREGTPLKCITRHMLGLFRGVPGARHWRRILSTRSRSEDVRGVFAEAMSKF